MKNIVLKQRAERDDLASRPYYFRKHIQDVAPYLETNVIKLITGPRRAGKSVYALQILSGKNYADLNFDDTQLLGSFDEDAVMQAVEAQRLPQAVLAECLNVTPVVTLKLTAPKKGKGKS